MRGKGFAESRVVRVVWIDEAKGTSDAGSVRGGGGVMGIGHRVVSGVDGGRCAGHGSPFEALKWMQLH